MVDCMNLGIRTNLNGIENRTFTESECSTLQGVWGSINGEPIGPWNPGFCFKDSSKSRFLGSECIDRAPTVQPTWNNDANGNRVGVHPQVSDRAEEMAVEPREDTAGNPISQEAIQAAMVERPWIKYALLGAGAFLILRLFK